LQCQSGRCIRCSQVGDNCCIHTAVAEPGYCHNGLDCQGGKCVKQTVR
jgi:hypothetical protein